jgi:hypothetical protein
VIGALTVSASGGATVSASAQPVAAVATTSAMKTSFIVRFLQQPARRSVAA